MGRYFRAGAGTRKDRIVETGSQIGRSCEGNANTRTVRSLFTIVVPSQVPLRSQVPKNRI